MSLSELIEALQIFKKYGDPDCPTHCVHDVMMICYINPSDVSSEDKDRLKELGFIVSKQDGEEVFISFKYGSA